MHRASAFTRSTQTLISWEEGFFLDLAFGIFTFKSPANLYFYKKFTHIDGNITFTAFSLDLVFSRRNPSVTNQYPYIYLAQRYCRIIFLVTIIFIDYHKTIRKQLLDDGVDDIDDKMVMLIIFMMSDDVGDFDDKMAMMTMIPIRSDDYK